MGWGHPGSPAQSPWGGRPCWSPPYLRWARPHCSGTAALHHHVWDTATTCTQERTNLLSTHATGGTLCLCNWMVALGGSQKPCASLPSYSAALGSSSPLRGVQGAPRAGRQPGLLLSQPEQPLPHTRPRHKDALLFLRRAKTEPGQSHPFSSGAVPGGHRGPLGGGPGKLGMSPGCSPAPRCWVTISSKRPLGVPRCRRATGQQSLQGGRGTRSPPRPRGTGMGKPPGCWGKGSSGEGEQWGRASCLLRPSTHLTTALRRGRRSRAALHTQDTAPATAPPAQAPSW